MTLALFDLDNTLLKGDSDHAWGEFLINHQLVNAEAYRRANDRFYGQYKDGTLDIREYNHFTLKFLSENNMETLDRLHRQFMQTMILPMIDDKARQLIHHHREQGHTLVIITATNRFVTGPIAAELNIEHLLAIEPKMVNGYYREWLADREETLQGSYFYSDSFNDLPLLEMVDHPVAVDPDPVLKQTAEQRGWPVISLRS